MMEVSSISGRVNSTGSLKKNENVNIATNEVENNNLPVNSPSNEKTPTTNATVKVSSLEFKREVNFLDSQIKSKGITPETVEKINQFNSLMVELSANGISIDDVHGLAEAVTDLRKLIDSIPLSTKRHPEFSAALGKFENDFQVFETLVKEADSAVIAYEAAKTTQVQAESDVTKAAEDFLSQKSFNPLARNFQRNIEEYNRVMQNSNTSEYHKIVMTTLTKKLTDKVMELKGQNLSGTQLESELTGVFQEHQMFMTRLNGSNAVTIEELKAYAPDLIEQAIMEIEREPVINPVGTVEINADIKGIPESESSGNDPAADSDNNKSGGSTNPVRFRDLPSVEQEKLIMKRIRGSMEKSPTEVQKIVNGSENPEELFKGVTMADIKELTDPSTKLGRSFTAFTGAVENLIQANQEVYRTAEDVNNSVRNLNDFVDSPRFENMTNNLANFNNTVMDLNHMATQMSMKQIVNDLLAEADKLASQLDLEIEMPDETDMMSLLERFRSIISELDENLRNLIQTRLDAKMIDINFMKSRKDNNDDLDRKDAFWKMIIKAFEESSEVKTPKVS